jgi:two-component system invasion response regulator UvrY
MTAPIRVLIVDDHPGVREAVADLVNATPGMVIVGEAVDGQDAVTRAAELRPDVVLMDVNMPNMSGLEAARVLTQQQPDVHVLLLSADVRSSDVQDARDAGATGFLAKAVRAGVLVRAIRDAYEGRPTWPDRA